VRWSLEARLLVRPATTYRQLSTRPLQSGLLVALRRPLLMAVALGCLASVIATRGVTLRLAAPAALYWLYVPLVLALALAAASATARGTQRGSGTGRPVTTIVDLYFAGRAPMVLFLLIPAAITLLPPYAVWTALTTWGIGGLFVGMAWSMRIDYCFFRDFLGQSPRSAAARLILLRLIVWPLVFGVFAVPGLSFIGFGEEVLAVVRELLGP
jgi:hypothetical protein